MAAVAALPVAVARPAWRRPAVADIESFVVDWAAADTAPPANLQVVSEATKPKVSF